MTDDDGGQEPFEASESGRRCCSDLPRLSMQETVSSLLKLHFKDKRTKGEPPWVLPQQPRDDVDARSSLSAVGSEAVRLSSELIYVFTLGEGGTAGPTAGIQQGGGHMPTAAPPPHPPCLTASLPPCLPASLPPLPHCSLPPCLPASLPPCRVCLQSSCSGQGAPPPPQARGTVYTPPPPHTHTG